jgi:hypothetical protein
MVEIMLREATVIEAKRKQDAHQVTLAAIGAAFSKGEAAASYSRALQKEIDFVSSGRRGGKVVAPGLSAQSVDQLRKDLRGRKK